MIALSPTEPVPKTATKSSMPTPSELMTAPASVMMPQPSGAQHLERRLFRHFDDASLADHGVRRERGLSLIIWWITAFSFDSGLDPSMRVPAKFRSLN